MSDLFDLTADQFQNIITNVLEGFQASHPETALPEDAKKVLSERIVEALKAAHLVQPWSRDPLEIATEAVLSLEAETPPETGDFHPLTGLEQQSWIQTTTNHIHRWRATIPNALIGPVEGVTALDASFASWLRRELGDNVRGNMWRERAAGLWEICQQAQLNAGTPEAAKIGDLLVHWISGGWAQTLALSVWDTTVRARIETARRGGMPLLFVRDIRPTLHPTQIVDGVTVPKPSKHPILASPQAGLAIMPDAIFADIAAVLGEGHIREIDALFRFCFRGWLEAAHDGAVAIPGGWDGFLRRLALPVSGEAQMRIKEATKAFTQMRLRSAPADGIGMPLLTGVDTPKSLGPGRWSPLVVYLSPVTGPNFLFRGAGKALEGADRFTIPVLPTPALHGINSRHIAGALRFDWALLEAARWGAEELLEGGPVVDLVTLARERASVDPKALAPTWKALSPGRWKLGGPGGDRLSLDPELEAGAPLAALIEGGRRTAAGRERKSGNDWAPGPRKRREH